MTWEIRMSNSRGVPYFFNHETQQSVWDPPSELSQEQIKALPGAELLPTPGAAPSSRPGQVRASHLLVKHSGSRRPSSWKEASITRSKEDAISILETYQSEIQSSPNPSQKFSELAQLHSDCSSHEKGGDLGWFSKGQMQKPFEEAAFGLEVGSITEEVVSTDSGVHLIMRTG